MRNSNEISAELDAKLRELEACQDAAQRKTLAEETDALTNEFNEASVSEAARRALANQRTLSSKEEAEMKRFSISKFIRQSMPGATMDGIEAEMAAEGKREFQESIKGSAEGVFLPSSFMRTYYYTNASEANYGQAFIEQTALSYDGKLRGAMLGEKLGVRYINGLQGQVAIVTGGADASWVAEEAAASKQKPEYTKAVLSPKRLQVLQGITYDLLHQSTKDVDRLIMEDMVKAHAAALDAAIFAGSGSSGQPTGVLNNASINSIYAGADDTAGAALTYAKLVQMETEVGIDNGLLNDTLAYVSNAKVQGKAKTIPQIDGYPYYLLNDGKVNGYPFYMTNAIPSNGTVGSSSGVCSAALFGPWSEVLVGGWGGLQFIVDPYSAKQNGVLEISAMAYHDVLVRHPAAFCKMIGITTA